MELGHSCAGSRTSASVGGNLILPQQRVVECENVLSNAKTCYTVPKCVTQRGKMLFIFKLIIHFRKRVIQYQKHVIECEKVC